ncbi:hypothetical protein HJFPF1_04716 [Paramyrothecium foliicola]|nr:hypothetical protein HJFPF1_04716 [Paramyrothecium foliicola]
MPSTGTRETPAASDPAPGETAAAGRPRKKRVLTEARKEQNRIAQKLFRQRRKEQLLRACAEKEQRSDRQLELRPRPQNIVENTHQSPASASPGSTFSESSSSDAASAVSVSTSHHWTDVNTWQDVEPLAVSPMSKKLALRKGEFHGFADPRANAIEFVQTTIFSAVLQNALCLGFDLAQLADCGTQNFMSPFYRPDAHPQDDPADLLQLCAASASGSNLKGALIPANLRPTLTQFLIPHHVSFDLIPIPLLRDRAIMLSVAMPHAFNVGELKYDIYQNGGLMVWKRSGDEWEADEPCQPWEMRSWEAAPWFLKKWSMAVDGENGELGQQSFSWQSLRRSQYQDQLSWSQLLQQHQT